MPKLQHPDSNHTVDAAPAQVPMYASQGWRPAKSPTSPKSKTTAKGGK